MKIRHSTAPSVSGIQPPLGTLVRLPATNALSVTSSSPNRPPTCHIGQFHCVAATNAPEDRGHHHGAHDRRAVGATEGVRGAEAEDKQHDGREHQPVDDRHVDLSLLVRGGLQHAQPRQQVEVHGLARHGEGTGDRGLRGDDRRGGREHHHPGQQLRRHQQIQRMLDGVAELEQQRALAEVVEHQCRCHQREPGDAHRAACRSVPCPRTAPRRR